MIWLISYIRKNCTVCTRIFGYFMEKKLMEDVIVFHLKVQKALQLHFPNLGKFLFLEIHELNGNKMET